MPRARFYMIADTTVISDVDNYASEWDPLDGSTTFSEGQPLSSDGGTTITHRAANTLADHPGFSGTPIDVDLVLDSTPPHGGVRIKRTNDRVPSEAFASRLGQVGTCGVDEVRGPQLPGQVLLVGARREASIEPDSRDG